MNPALGLLLVGVGRHYLWPHAPVWAQGMASKGLGACAILALLCIVYAQHRRAWPVLLWWAWEELQVVLCSAAWMLEPWTVEPGQGVCQARIGFDIGAAGLVAVAWLVFTLSDVAGSNSKRERTE